MTPERRAHLEWVAYPPQDVRLWRLTFRALLATATVVAFCGLYFVALIVAVLALPTLVRYVRREWALGALLAEDIAARLELQSIPEQDGRLGGMRAP